MNLKKITPKLFVSLLFILFGFKSLAQQPGCYMIPDLDGYKRAYKMNYGGAQGYKEFFKAYKDSYVDTAYYIANSLKALNPSNAGWRLTDQVGPAFPYCGALSAKNANTNLSADENMFLKYGAYNNLEADRMLGKKGMFGVGVLGGYTFYRVDQTSYETKYNAITPQYKINGTTSLMKSKPYEIFYLLVGPVATFGLGKKLNLDLTVKAGPAHNDIAYVANKTSTNELVHAVLPTNKKWAVGGNIGMRLMYKFAQNWGLGFNANAFNSNTEYQTIDINQQNGLRGPQAIDWKRKQSNFNAGIAIQHIWPTSTRPVYVPLNRIDPPVAAPVAITPSIVSPCNQTFNATPFNNEFSWTSNDNLEDKANEMYVFKLYKVPSTEPILVKTQKENTLRLDSPLSTPNDVCSSDEYYYTVHSTKGASFSEMVTCSFKIQNAAAAGANCALAKAEVGNAVAAAAPVYLTRILGNESFTRQIVKYDEGKGCKCPIDTLTRTGSKLVEYYKQYTDGHDLNTWPDGLPIPRKATGFIYEVRQVYEPGSGNQKAGPAERYRLDVDKRTRAVRLTPIRKR